VSAILKRDHHGVLLRYSDPGEIRQHHVERKIQPTDRQRCALIEAEREWFKLKVIFECLDGAPQYALDRIAYALETIRVALDFKRKDLGMADVVRA
jgi:hypothetical protein